MNPWLTTLSWAPAPLLFAGVALWEHRWRTVVLLGLLWAVAATAYVGGFMRGRDQRD